MKLLFLRGQVPQDRDPKQIMFDNIEDCDDVWTQLAYNLTNDYGEIWYWNGNRTVRYRDNFIERWIPSFKDSKYDFKPDVIFARGGFPEFDHVLNRNPNAFKIYYGAGKRFYPTCVFKNFDLIINDTPKQVSISKSKFPKSKVSLFIKPAADNIFFPVAQQKIYDIIYVSNEHPHKGHIFAFNAIPKDMKILHVGKASPRLKQQFPHIHFNGWVPRKDIPKLYAQSKISICCCENIDSCPRIVAESLACDCPMLVLKNVNLWVNKYITEETGSVCSRDTFQFNLIEMVKQYKVYNAYQYYSKNLSMKIAVQHLKDIIL